MSVERSVPIDVGTTVLREKRPSADGRVAHWLSVLTRPRVSRAVIVLALALCVPTLWAGFALDDYILLSRMSQPDQTDWAGGAPFDLFRWFDPEHNQPLIDGKGMPWWTFEGARCAFFRPISSLTHALDYALFSHNPGFMHAHSLLWLACLLLLTARLYSELLDNPHVSALAAIMFALDSAHGTALGWISNRNALLAAGFGVLALGCHHHARARSSRSWALAAYASFSLALLSGELALGAAGYLFAYACFFDTGTRTRRALSLAPYAVVMFGWALARHMGRYGSYGIGAYVDPLAEPLDFLRTLPLRWFVLMGSQTGGLTSDLFALVPPRFVVLFGLAAVLITLASLWFVWPVLRRHRALRMFSAGAALSALPLAATIPADRLLVLTGVGVMPTLAYAIVDALKARSGFQTQARLQAILARRRAAVLFAGVRVALQTVLLPVSALSPALIAHWTETAEASVPRDPAIEHQTLIVAAVPDSVLMTYVPPMRAWRGTPAPERLYWLQANAGEVRFERRDGHTLRVSSAAGVFDRRSEARSLHFAFKPGDRVTLSEMTVEIVELNQDGLPSVCDFVFTKPLESANYRWLTWREGRLQSFQLPAPGESRWLFTS